MSDYIVTFTNTKFFPLSPEKKDIKIEDIAHALSQLPRANGHFKHFYSVGQHSINCYHEAVGRNLSSRIQLGCLLHDASEAYIADLTRPVKRNIPEYLGIEEKLQNKIYEQFGIGDLSESERRLIEEIDDTMLYYEFDNLMDLQVFDYVPEISMEHDLSQRGFSEVKEQFMQKFYEVTKLKY